MAQGIFNQPDWFRTVERQFECQEYTGTPLRSDFDFSTDSILPGHVATIVDGELHEADQSLAGGAFHGLFYSEISSDLDETNQGDIDPVVLRGPGTAKVWDSALDSGSTYETSATDVVELVAVNGLLTPRDAETGPTVATLIEVQSDGILVQLNAPDTHAV